MERKIGTARPRTKLSSVTNAMRLVQVFSDEAHELSISEIGRRLSLPKSTAHRLATTLVQAGLLEQNQKHQRYRLGILMFEMGAMVQRQLKLLNDTAAMRMEYRSIDMH